MVFLMGLALAVGVAGCRIYVDKDANGYRKPQIHLLAELGIRIRLLLPILACRSTRRKWSKITTTTSSTFIWALVATARVHDTTDSQEKVVEFYKRRWVATAM